VPAFSTGERGPAIALLALFQAYDAAVSVIEDREIVAAAQEARTEAERQAEAARWAR
jgi:predicted NodU family carbamoyl transferase